MLSWTLQFHGFSIKLFLQLQCSWLAHAAIVSESQFPIGWRRPWGDTRDLNGILQHHRLFYFKSNVFANDAGCLAMFFCLEHIYVLFGTITWYIFCSSCVWVFDCVHQSVLSWEKMRRDPSTNTICTETMKPCSALAHTNTKIKSNNCFRCVSTVKLPLLGPRKSGTDKSSVNMWYFAKDAREIALVNPLFWSAGPQDEIIEGCPMWHVTWAANLLLHFWFVRVIPWHVWHEHCAQHFGLLFWRLGFNSSYNPFWISMLLSFCKC
jgi:hypothetical protein